MIPYERYSWREVGCQVANLCSVKLHLAFDTSCVGTSPVNCDRKISCLSVHFSCPASCSFLSHPYWYVYTRPCPTYRLCVRLCVCIAMELRMRGTRGPSVTSVRSWRLMDFGVWDFIKEDLVLTPQAGAFVPSGQAPTDGTILGSSSRLLACVRGLITCHQVIILTLPHSMVIHTFFTIPWWSSWIFK